MIVAIINCNTFFFRVKIIKDTEDPFNHLKMVMHGHWDGVLVLPSAMVNYFNQKNLGRGHVNVGTEIVATYLVCFYYPKNSPFYMMFDKVISQLHVSGIFNYWLRSFGETSYFDLGDAKPKQLNFDGVSGIFIIWALGLFLCTVVFVIELVYGILSVDKNNRLKAVIKNSYL